MTFVVYSKDGCPYCDKIQKVLEISDISHLVYKLDKDYSREEFYSMFGKGSTFPKVVLNEDTIIGGCSETIKYLKENKLV